MKITKKEQEKQDLDLFVESLGVLYSDINSDVEAPDFDLVLNSEKVGIEFTEYILNQSYSSIIRSNNFVLDKLNRQIESLVKRYKTQGVVFNYVLQDGVVAKINKIEKVGIFQILSSCFTNRLILENLNKDFFRHVFKFNKSESQFIREVRITVNKDIEKIVVSRDKSWLSGVIPHERIREIVESKDSKMDFDRNDVTWLVITVAGEDYSSGIVDIQNWSFNSAFDRIFILEKFPKKLMEISVV